MKTSTVAFAALAVLAQLVSEGETKPDLRTVDEPVLLGLGALLVASAVAFKIGRQTAINDINAGQTPSGGIFPDVFGRRRRRQARPENELDPLVEKLFQMAQAKDKDGCNLRLVCVVGNRPASSLTGNMKDTRDALSATIPDKTPTVTKSSWKGLDAYQVAFNYGRDGGDCDKLFTHCPSSSRQLTNTYQQLHLV